MGVVKGLRELCLAYGWRTYTREAGRAGSCPKPSTNLGDRICSDVRGVVNGKDGVVGVFVEDLVDIEDATEGEVGVIGGSSADKSMISTLSVFTAPLGSSVLVVESLELGIPLSSGRIPCDFSS